MSGPSRMMTRRELRGRPRDVRYFAQGAAQGKPERTGEPWQWLPKLSGRSDALRNFLTAQGFEQGRQEVAEGQHHQGEAGVLLAEVVVTTVLCGLVL